MDAYKNAGNRKDEPPKHEMVHFPGLLSSKREFGDFRTVLHTGLYSQVVAMEVPVGGDIGDEVRRRLPCAILQLSSWICFCCYSECTNAFREKERPLKIAN